MALNTLEVLTPRCRATSAPDIPISSTHSRAIKARTLLTKGWEKPNTGHRSAVRKVELGGKKRGSKIGEQAKLKDENSIDFPCKGRLYCFQL